MLEQVRGSLESRSTLLIRSLPHDLVMGGIGPGSPLSPEALLVRSPCMTLSWVGSPVLAPGSSFLKKHPPQKLSLSHSVSGRDNFSWNHRAFFSHPEHFAPRAIVQVWVAHKLCPSVSPPNWEPLEGEDCPLSCLDSPCQEQVLTYRKGSKVAKCSNKRTLGFPYLKLTMQQTPFYSKQQRKQKSPF